jgi:hypothetical protein
MWQIQQLFIYLKKAYFLAYEGSFNNIIIYIIYLLLRMV